MSASSSGSHKNAQPSKEEIIAWDQDYLWHPFTAMQDYRTDQPVVIERAEGIKLIDVHGDQYYDGVSSVWLNVHGHCVPELNEALQEQAQKIAHSTVLGQGNVPAAHLAKRLTEITPAGLCKVFLSDSGATAVEIALKIAIQYWANEGQAEKKHILGFNNNYHGDTMGAMSVAPDPLFHWAFLDRLPRNPRVPFPYLYRDENSQSPEECRQASLRAVEKCLTEQAHELAAIIVEPVQGAGGIIPAPVGFLKELSELAARHDVLLIVDEVATGFGRCGTWFACDSEQVSPDLLCMGKGITGGYLPVAATLASQKLYDSFLGDRRRAFYHGHSYTGNQLGCAVALKNLELMEDLLPALAQKADFMSEALQKLKRHEIVGDLRHRGFMSAVELVADHEAKECFPADWRAGYTVMQAAKKRGMLIRPVGPNVIFMPPLAATQEQLEEMIDILDAALEDCSADLMSRWQKHQQEANG